MSVTDFLAVLFPDENEAIHFRAFKPPGAPDTPDNQPVKLAVTRHELRSSPQLQQRLKTINQTRGLYFVVNTGGNQDKAITRFNACFVENDTSPLSEQHAAYDNCSLQPSVRTETRKSIHSYWPLEPGATAEEWLKVQARLITHFHGDPVIKNLSRVMRLPYSYHLHYDSETGQTTRQRVKLHTCTPERRFTISQLLAAFPDTQEKTTQPPIGGSTHYSTWDEMNAELRRRMLAHSTMRSQRRVGAFARHLSRWQWCNCAFTESRHQCLLLCEGLRDGRHLARLRFTRIAWADWERAYQEQARRRG